MPFFLLCAVLASMVMDLVAALAFKDAVLGYPVGLAVGEVLALGIYRIFFGPLPWWRT
ncbi:MAG TPA: hypothetical protein VNH82_03715 [Candidatus Dormibacteraeota bacterium]|nr:hypothetical protein [Candidatus Dormibacteraeota bacterium]